MTSNDFGQPVGRPVVDWHAAQRPDGKTLTGRMVRLEALTIAATEAMYLMMAHAFDNLGFRRYEWKCDSHNAPSRAAAERLGFSYEGTFAQHLVVKGRNRDTAWFAITDEQWHSSVGPALRAWLAPDDFDESGNQRASLSSLRSWR